MAVFSLTSPRIVAIATDKYLTQTHPFRDTRFLAGKSLKYGQDFTFATGRSLPAGNPSAGTTESVLKTRMSELLNQFAQNDSSQMAQRLFTRFLSKNKAVQYFDDPGLNNAAKSHSNIKFFCKAALNKPSEQVVSGKVRIHQALKNAGWDINKINAPGDLGVPAFNKGNKNWFTRSGDFTNGLGVMINGVQHAIVVAKEYNYDSARRKYDITLQYLFYDVFGLDDEDVQEYGADGGIETNPGASWGITAWWQLQHQFSYAPLVTRIAFEISHVGVAAV